MNLWELLAAVAAWACIAIVIVVALCAAAILTSGVIVSIRQQQNKSRP